MIVLYSTGCPRCKVLKKKLDEAKADYNVVSDVDQMLAMGLKEAPVLEVDGQRMEFAEAVKWVNCYGKG